MHYLIISAASSPLKGVVCGLPLGDGSTKPLCPPLRSVRPTEAASSLHSNVLYDAGVGGNGGPLDAVAVCVSSPVEAEGGSSTGSVRRLSMYTFASFCSTVYNVCYSRTLRSNLQSGCMPLYLCAVAEYFMISRATMLHPRSSLSDRRHKT